MDSDKSENKKRSEAACAHGANEMPEVLDKQTEAIALQTRNPESHTQKTKLVPLGKRPRGACKKPIVVSRDCDDANLR